MNRLLSLQQKKTALYDEASAIIKKAETENRPLSDQEMTDISEKRTAMTAIVNSLAAENALSEFTAESVATADAAPVRRSAIEVHDNKADAPFASLGEQLRCVMDAARPGHSIDARLSTRAASGMNESAPSDGGFLVQTDFSNDLLRRMYETGILTSRVRRVPIKADANGLKINAIDETSRANGSRLGGIVTYWQNEADLIKASKPKFRQVHLILQKLTAACYATDELLEDTVALQAIIQGTENQPGIFAEEFAYVMDDMIMEGSGAGQPLGFLNSPALVTVPKETGQAAGTLVAANIIKMNSRLWSKSRKNAVWLVNQDVEPQLTTLSVATGANSGSLIYMPPNGLSEDGYATLYGRPVIPIEQANTVGTPGDIMLVDLSQYLMIDKGGLQQASSMHVRFLYDEMVFRFTYRVDGQPAWNVPLTPAKGGNTTSPFVVLQAR